MAKPKKKPAKKRHQTYHNVIDPRNAKGRHLTKYGKALIERDQTVRDLKNQVHALEKVLEHLADYGLTTMERDLDSLAETAREMIAEASRITLALCNLRTIIKRPALLQPTEVKNG